MTQKWQQQIDENLGAWDAIAAMHARGSGAQFYRIQQFLDGECRLSPWEIEELGDVSGKSLLHLQCHIGVDTLCWARRGATVTGLDFSSAAIAEAELFAQQLNIQDASFVVSTIANACQTLSDSKYDIIYTGRGALCWLPDLDAWAGTCASLLKPGGTLYLEEVHPMLSLMEVVPDSDPPVLQPTYQPFSDQPTSDETSGSYADPDADTGLHAYHMWEHSFADIITPLIAQGFQIELLQERAEGFFNPFADMMEAVSPHHWKFKESFIPIPMSFTLKARYDGA